MLNHTQYHVARTHTREWRPRSPNCPYTRSTLGRASPTTYTYAPKSMATSSTDPPLTLDLLEPRRRVPSLSHLPSSLIRGGGGGGGDRCAERRNPGRESPTRPKGGRWQAPVEHRMPIARACSTRSLQYMRSSAVSLASTRFGASVACIRE